MSLTDEERQLMVELELGRAGKILGQIDDLARLGFWDNVANRLYYALFHAVSALLIHDGRKVHTHKGVALAFGQYYVKSGLLPTEAGRLFSRLQSMREANDYNCAFMATEEDIAPWMEPTKQLIDTISTMVARQPN